MQGKRRKLTCFPDETLNMISLWYFLRKAAQQPHRPNQIMYSILYIYIYIYAWYIVLMMHQNFTNSNEPTSTSIAIPAMSFFLGLVKDMCCPKVSFTVPCWRSSHLKNHGILESTRLVHLRELIWLVVSIQLKHISQNGNLPQEGVNKNAWNHHLVIFDCCCYSYHSYHTRPK